MSRKDLAATALFAEKGAARPTALATSERRVRMNGEGASASAPGHIIQLTRRSKEAPAALLPFEEGLPLEEDPGGTGSLVEFALERVEPVGVEPVGAKAVQELLVTASEPAVAEPAVLPPSRILSGWGLAAAIATAILLAIGIWLAASRDGPSVGRTVSEVETPAPTTATLPTPTQTVPSRIAPVQAAQALPPPTASDREAGRAGKAHVPAVVALPSSPRDPAVPRQVAVTDQLAAFEPTGLVKPAKPAALAQVSATSIGVLPPTPARKPDQTTLSGSGYWLQLFAGRNPRRTGKERLRLAQDHADLLGIHSLQVVAADVEGYGTFYRIRTGVIGDRQEATALCERLKARDQECLPLKVEP